MKKYIICLLVLFLPVFLVITTFAQIKTHNVNKDEEIKINFLEKDKTIEVKLDQNKLVKLIYNKEISFYETLAKENFTEIKNLMHKNAIISSGFGKENINELLFAIKENKNVKLMLYSLADITIIKNNDSIVINYRLERVFKEENIFYLVKGISTSVYYKEKDNYKIILHHYSLIDAKQINLKDKKDMDY